MDLFDEFKEIVRTIGEQISYSSDSSGHTPYIDTSRVYFTYNFQAEAREWGLTEEDAIDVYYYGCPLSEDTMIKEYNGYEIGINFHLDYSTGQPVISSIWKHEEKYSM